MSEGRENLKTENMGLWMGCARSKNIYSHLYRLFSSLSYHMQAMRKKREEESKKLTSIKIGTEIN